MLKPKGREMRDFIGAKLVLLVGDKMVTLLRDDRSDIPWPGHWDLPGGGREGDETPEECVLRETWEETALRLAPEDLVWKHWFASPTTEGQFGVWFAARVAPEMAEKIVLGDEGQAVELVAPEAWFSRDKLVPHFVPRVKAALAHL